MKAKSENFYNQNPTIAHAIGLSLEYWRASKTMDVAQGGFLMRKAYFTLATAKERLGSHVNLLLTLTFLHLELDNLDLADDLLRHMAPLKNAMKSDSPNIYVLYLFLLGVKENKNGKVRGTRKQLRLLCDYETAGIAWLPGLLAGILRLNLNEAAGAVEEFTHCFELGCRSVFLYTYLAKALSSLSAPSSVPDDLRVYFTRWCIIHQYDLRNLPNTFTQALPDKFFQSALWRDKLYMCCDDSATLTRVCTYFMQSMNYSTPALKFYLEADSKHLRIPDLAHFIVKSASRVHLEKLSRNIIDTYLRTADDTDVALTAYVYHILLTAASMKKLLESRLNSIMQFAMFCLENNLKGRYFHTIYRYVIVAGAGIGAKHISLAEEILRPVLFTYEVRVQNPLARSIVVAEWEKKDVSVYPLRDGVTRIDALDNCKCICLTAEGRVLYDEQLTMTKLVENVLQRSVDTEPEARLYEYFFSRGDRSFSLLAAMAKPILQINNPDDAVLPILTALLTHIEISAPFASRIKAVLGKITLDAGLNDIAFQYYAEVDEKYLEDRHIEHMLLVFLGAKQWNRAVKLVVTKFGVISEKTLFGALKQISVFTKFNAAIAEPAFHLLRKSWYDKRLLSIVLTHYKGSQEDWRELSRVLAAASITEFGLDEIILRGDVWMRQMNEASQRIFARMANQSPTAPIVREYAYYCVYETLVNSFKPLYETIDALEKLFLQDQNSDLAYALGHVYLNHSIHTVFTNEILAHACRLQEENALLFPVFKNHKNSFPVCPHVEKNQPFQYKSSPGKEVWLYYKRLEEKNYRRRPMQYYRFGLYFTHLVMFYGEVYQYYYREENSSGDSYKETKEMTIRGGGMYMADDGEDSYGMINQAVVFEQMFKYDQTEKLLEKILKEPKDIKAKLL